MYMTWDLAPPLPLGSLGAEEQRKHSQSSATGHPGQIAEECRGGEMGKRWSGEEVRDGEETFRDKYGDSISRGWKSINNNNSHFIIYKYLSSTRNLI